MSPKIEDFPDRSTFAEISPSEDFILIRVAADGQVTTLSTLDEDDAVDLLRQTADEVEDEGFELQAVQGLS
jgi:hypothetical protein